MDASFDSVAARIPRWGELLLRLDSAQKADCFDIRLTAGQPVLLWGREGAFFLRENGGLCRGLTEGLSQVSAEEVQDLLDRLCGYSVFSHEDELRRGWIRLADGCRVGLCGTAVTEHGAVLALREVTGLCFRIPRQTPGCADRLFLEGADLSAGMLLVGEPSSGKTTVLRDVIRSLCTGKFSPVRRVSVLDERGELSWGELGPGADVLVGWPRAAAFDLATRMLSPQFLACDELSPDDLPVVEQSVFAGVPLLATVHGDPASLKRRPLVQRLLQSGAFGSVVMLSGRQAPGEIAAISRWQP